MVEKNKQKRREKKQHVWQEKTTSETILRAHRNRKGIDAFTKADANKIIKACLFKNINSSYLCEILNKVIVPLFLQKQFTLEYQPTITDKKLVCKKIKTHANALQKTLQIAYCYPDLVRWGSIDRFLRSLSRLVMEVETTLCKLSSGKRQKERNSVNKAAVFLIQRLAYIFYQYSGVEPKITYTEHYKGQDNDYNNCYKDCAFLILVELCINKILAVCDSLKIDISNAFPKNRGAIAETIKDAINQIDFSKALKSV
jgi:hypothetical protein